jgi:hypothetical protein
MAIEIRNKMRGSQSTVLDPSILVPAIWQSFIKRLAGTSTRIK